MSSKPSDSGVTRSGRMNMFLEVGPYFKDGQSKIRSYARIPVTVLRGSRPGPTLCVTAGVHATEYAGIAAAIKLSRELEPSRLSGSLVITKVVNVVGFAERAYLCPLDGVNIQGTFPGRKDGSLSFQISKAVFDELISKSDYYVDLHGGDIHESEVGFSVYYKTGDESLDRKSEAMARALGFQYIFAFEENSAEGSSYRVAAEHGKPSCLCELGQGDILLQDEVDRVFNGIVNVLRYLGMISGELIHSKEEEQRLVKFAEVGVSHSGFLLSEAKPGDIFDEGNELGKVFDLEGNVLEVLRAPSHGVVALMIHNPVVEPGEKPIIWGTFV